MSVPIPFASYGVVLATPDRALEIGKAAEHLVCCDLILAGYRAFLTDQGLPYDIVIDLGGRLVRVQVKAATRAKNANARGRAERRCYVYHVRRVGKFGKKRLDTKDCDIVALVALDRRLVGYLPIQEIAQTVSISEPGFVFTGRTKKGWMREFGDLPIEAAMARATGGRPKLKGLGA